MGVERKYILGYTMIYLRRITESDLPILFEYRNDFNIYKWCRQYGPLHHEKHKDWYHWQANDSKTEMFSICHNNEMLPIGVCGLTDIDFINSRAEFSLYIGKKFQGHGHAKDALRELFHFGFKSLNLNMIWGETFDGNPAMHLFKKIGMEVSGVRPQFYYKDGEYIDAHLLYITREKWLNT